MQNESLNLCCRRTMRRAVMFRDRLMFWAQKRDSEDTCHVIFSARCFDSFPRVKSALSGVVREENDGAARPSDCVNKR